MTISVLLKSPIGRVLSRVLEDGAVGEEALNELCGFELRHLVPVEADRPPLERICQGEKGETVRRLRTDYDLEQTCVFSERLIKLEVRPRASVGG